MFILSDHSKFVRIISFRIRTVITERSKIIYALKDCLGGRRNVFDITQMQNFQKSDTFSKFVSCFYSKIS